MRLIDRAVSRMDPTMQPVSAAQVALVQSYTDGSYERMLPTFQSYASEGYASNGIVFSVILSRLSLFAEAEFKFRDLATKKLYGTPALDLLENPWPGGTTGELLARMEQDGSLAGNAYVRDAGDQLERLRPDRVTIISGERDDGLRVRLGYGYDRDGVGDLFAEVYPVGEVAHWSPIPDPLATYRGMSWLTPVVREVNADMAMTTHKQSFFDKAATPNLLVKYQMKLDEKKITRISDQLQAKHSGPENSWRSLVLDEGADATVIGSNFEQMNFAGVQAAGENRIAAAGGVPAIVVGLKEGLDAATYSNYGMAMRRFADITMRPNWRSAAACLATLVDVPAGSRLWYDTTDIAALQEGEQERAETSRTLAVAAGEFIRAGYAPDTVAAALIAGDLSLLTHTGAIPTALYPDGKAPAASARSVARARRVERDADGFVSRIIDEEG